MPTAGNQLQLSFGINAPQSRAIITDTKLPDNSPVGVRLDGYADYANLVYTGSTTGSKQTWASTTSVVLTNTKGTLYAYYPQNNAVSIDAIDVDMTAADQTDWLYATPVTDVNKNKASVSVTMNHAAANINVKVNKGSYLGDGKITNITVQSDGIALGGTFNAAKSIPGYEAYEDEGKPLSRTVTTTANGTATDIMVVPTGTSAPITLTLTIDGQVYTAVTSTIALQSGLSYIYELIMSANSLDLQISLISASDWLCKDYTLPELQPELPWVTATYYVNQFTIDIGMSPLTGYLMMLGFGELTDFVDRMIVDGVETAVADTGFETAGEHTVKFLFKDNAKLIPPMFFAFNLNLTEVDWNGSDWVVSQAAFCLCPDLKKIPDWHTMASVGQGAFVYTGLEKLELPADWPTLSMLENNTFTTGFCSSPSMTSITVHPDNPLFFVPEGSNALMVRPELGIEGFLFGACANTVIPDNTTIIADYAFASVYSPKTTEELLVFLLSDDMSMISQPVELVLPESVQLVQPGAFSENIYLTSVTFGSNIMSLSDPFRPLLLGCPALNKIVSKAVSAPSFEHSGTVFDTGTLYVPQGATGYEDWLNSLGSGWTLQNID